MVRVSKKRRAVIDKNRAVFDKNRAVFDKIHVPPSSLYQVIDTTRNLGTKKWYIPMYHPPSRRNPIPAGRLTVFGVPVANLSCTSYE